MPPIVGVPIFSMCVCGPSSRMRWPHPHARNARIATGVPSSVTASATAAASRIDFTAAPPRSRSRPATRDALNRTRSPGSRRPPHVVERLRRGRRSRPRCRARPPRGGRRRRSSAPRRRPRSAGPRGSAPPARRSARAPAAAIGPSSAMGPSTAIRWPSPAIHRAARSAAAIDSGLALYASLTTRTPAGVVNVSIRHCDTTACDRASAHGNERHAERDAGGRGGQRVRDHVLPGHGQRHRRALGPVGPGGTTRTRPPPATTPSARTSASGASPNVTTRAAVLPA